jgi:hypothetical protein
MLVRLAIVNCNGDRDRSAVAEGLLTRKEGVQEPQRGAPTRAQGNALGIISSPVKALKGRSKAIRLGRPFRAFAFFLFTQGVALG